jgi:protein-S-isoprenylcysteine O-methyltransferase Ste14
MSDKTQAILLVLLQFVLFALLAGALLLLPAGQIDWLRLVGVILVCIGLVVVAISLLNHIQVNRAMVNISPEPNAELQLVEIGLYRWIRHPIYLGVILVAVGATLAHGHWIAFTLAILIVLLFTYKSGFEERWLMRVYSNYADYRLRTGRFLPPMFRRSR